MARWRVFTFFAALACLVMAFIANTAITAGYPALLALLDEGLEWLGVWLSLTLVGTVYFLIRYGVRFGRPTKPQPKNALQHR